MNTRHRITIFNLMRIITLVIILSSSVLIAHGEVYAEAISNEALHNVIDIADGQESQSPLVSDIILQDSGANLGSLAPNPQEQSPFTDVPSTHWAYEYIKYLFDHGYIEGCQVEPERMFCPDRNLNRGEKAVVMIRYLHPGESLYKPPTPTVKIFDDVPVGADAPYFSKYVHELYEKGFTKGCSTTSTLYCPPDPMTRAQATVYFVRGVEGADYEPPYSDEQIYKDVAPKDSASNMVWYHRWVKRAHELGIVQNCGTDMENMLFYPERAIKRDEAACMMFHALKVQKVDAPTINPAGGTFTGPVAVTLSTSTPGAEIRYTLDGSTPNIGSPLYQSNPGLVIQQSATLKAKAFKVDMAGSDMASAIFTINPSQPKPDLAVKDIAWSPASPGVGESVSFSITLKNEGDADTEASSIECRLGSATGTLIGQIGLVVLKAGEERTYGCGATTFASAVSYEVYGLVKTEPEEENTANNERHETVAVEAKPDLAVKDIAWSPASPGVGESVSFSITLKNEGDADTEASSIECRLGSATGTLIGQIGLVVLKAGEERTYGCGATTFASAGSYQVYGLVKTEPEEENTANNEMHETIIVGQPDLAVQDISWSPGLPMIDTNVAFSVRVKNEGGSATEAVSISCRLGSSTGTLIGQAMQVPFDAGETRTVSCGSRTFSKAGTYEIYAVVETEPVEENIANNTLHKTMTVTDVLDPTSSAYARKSR